MPSERQLKKEEQIRKDFAAWDTSKYQVDFILQQMEKKWFLSPRTLWAIISGEYDQRRQHTMSSQKVKH